MLSLLKTNVITINIITIFIVAFYFGSKKRKKYGINKYYYSNIGEIQDVSRRVQVLLRKLSTEFSFPLI